MKTITFTCETITPMFLSGADGQTPELRPPSIKGALRFWWRAMNGNNSNLRADEAEKFGGTDDGSGKSKVLIRTINIQKIKTEPISLTPHHKNGYCLQNDRNKNCQGWDRQKNYCNKAKPRDAAFFNFDLKINFDENVISQIELENLVKITFLLGGFGKRTRRGFGSIRITSIDNAPITETKEDIEEFLRGFRTINLNSTSLYPFIKNIEIGSPINNYKQLLEKISLSSHYNSDTSIGTTRGGKFASPIYVSIFKTNEGYFPIITTLYGTFNGRTLNNTTNQSSFKTAIL